MAINLLSQENFLLIEQLLQAKTADQLDDEDMQMLADTMMQAENESRDLPKCLYARFAESEGLHSRLVKFVAAKKNITKQESAPNDDPMASKDAGAQFAHGKRQRASISGLSRGHGG